MSADSVDTEPGVTAGLEAVVGIVSSVDSGAIRKVEIFEVADRLTTARDGRTKLLTAMAAALDAMVSTPGGRTTGVCAGTIDVAEEGIAGAMSADDGPFVD